MLTQAVLSVMFIGSAKLIAERQTSMRKTHSERQEDGS